MAPLPRPVCVGCQKSPADIEEYVDAAESCGVTPEIYVRQEEGTYNEANGHFLCTDCYIAAGMPTSPGGWVTP